MLCSGIIYFYKSYSQNVGVLQTAPAPSTLETGVSTARNPLYIMIIYELLKRRSYDVVSLKNLFVSMFETFEEHIPSSFYTNTVKI